MFVAVNRLVFIIVLFLMLFFYLSLVSFNTCLQLSFICLLAVLSVIELIRLISQRYWTAGLQTSSVKVSCPQKKLVIMFS
jgi:hypothetical protein